jgi:hypothetical protein
METPETSTNLDIAPIEPLLFYCFLKLSGFWLYVIRGAIRSRG